MASVLSQSFEVIKNKLDWLPPDTANIISYHRHHWWWCTFFKRVTFFAQRAQNFGQFCCEFSHFFVHFYRALKCGVVPKMTNIMYVFTLQECSPICCRMRIIQNIQKYHCCTCIDPLQGQSVY